MLVQLSCKMQGLQNELSKLLKLEVESKNGRNICLKCYLSNKIIDYAANNNSRKANSRTLLKK